MVWNFGFVYFDLKYILLDGFIDGVFLFFAFLFIWFFFLIIFFF